MTRACKNETLTIHWLPIQIASVIANRSDICCCIVAVFLVAVLALLNRRSSSAPCNCFPEITPWGWRTMAPIASNLPALHQPGVQSLTFDSFRERFYGWHQPEHDSIRLDGIQPSPIHRVQSFQLDRVMPNRIEMITTSAEFGWFAATRCEGRSTAPGSIRWWLWVRLLLSHLTV